MKQASPSVAEIDAYALSNIERATFSELEKRGARRLALGFGAYSLVVLGLSGAGFFDGISTNFFAGTVVLATLGLSLAYLFSRSVRALAERLGPYGLAGFHIWRIAAALAFLYYGAQGWLPETFVSLAGWGDMLAGVLAAIVLVLPRSHRLVSGFHVIGFADFLVAVGTGVVLTQIAASSMANISELPISIIPLIGVPLSGATHIAALHILWKRRGNTV